MKARGDIAKNYVYCGKGDGFEYISARYKGGPSTMDSPGWGENAVVYTNITLLEVQHASALTKWQQEHLDLVTYFKKFQLKPWQKELYDVLTTRCNDRRTVHWYWEGEGNQGKSWFTQYMYEMVPDVLLAAGKAGDIFNMITNFKEVDIVPRICILDCPRAMNKEHINMLAIEKLKDGCMFAGKYHGGIHSLFSPHVVVFANVPPSAEQRAQLSTDRWNVGEIQGDGRIVRELDASRDTEPEWVNAPEAKFEAVDDLIACEHGKKPGVRCFACEEVAAILCKPKSRISVHVDLT